MSRPGYPGGGPRTSMGLPPKLPTAYDGRSAWSTSPRVAPVIGLTYWICPACNDCEIVIWTPPSDPFRDLTMSDCQPFFEMAEAAVEEHEADAHSILTVTA